MISSFKHRTQSIVVVLLFWSLLSFLGSAAFAQTPLRRVVSPEQPMWLVHIDTWNYPDPQKIIDLVPMDIRPYVVMNISLSMTHDADNRYVRSEYPYEIAKSWLRTCAENRMWAIVQPASGAYGVLPDNDMTIYEEFYRDYPNLIGFSYSEQSWGYGDDSPLATNWPNRMAHLTKLLELGNKYGGYLVVSWCGNQYVTDINPIAMQKRNPAFAAACTNYTKNYILCEKYTFKTYQHDMESVCLGSYLSGYSGNYGIRYDDSGWTDADGNINANFTMATKGAPFLEHVMLTGQTVIDGPELIWRFCFTELSAAATTNGYTMRRWNTFPEFDNVSVDLFRKILDGAVRIPSRQEVIDRTKLVIINDVNSGSNDNRYSSPQTLFDGLYSFDGNYGNNRSFFKKTGRYPTIPTVYSLNDDIAKSFEVKVNRSGYSSRWPTVDSKVTELKNLFPQEYTGTLYAGRYENGWVVYNPFKTNTIASGNIPFKYNTCESIDMDLSQYTSGVIKEFANKLNIYLTNYDNTLNPGLKTNVVKIYGSTSEPSFTYDDRGSHEPSIITKSWANGVFTIAIEHNGPVDLVVNCAGGFTNRLTQYQTANIVVPPSPPVYFGSRQYESEMFDYKSIASVVKAGYPQAIRNYTGQGYLNFGTNSAASVRDFVTVPNEGLYLLETRYTAADGDVGTIDVLVNGIKVSTPTFLKTAELSSWAVNSQTVELKKGTNTIEFKANATGVHAIYFDNIVVSVSSSNHIWLEAECGGVGSLWEFVNAADASNGYCVRVKTGNSSNASAPENSDAHCTYGFNVAESGDYNVWGRVLVSANDAAFWVKTDDAAWSLWNNLPLSGSWTWVKINTSTLSQGSHVLKVAYNTEGAMIDKLVLVKSADTPVGIGGAASNCLVSNQSPIAFAGSDKTVYDADDNGVELVVLNSLGSVDVDGTIVSYVWSIGANVIATGANPGVSLPVGKHTVTLTVTDSEGATGSDQVVVTVFKSDFQYYNILHEPECGTVGANWDVISSTEASNGFYVTAKPGMQSTSSAPATNDGLITIPFAINSSGSYAVYGRMFCANYSSDSFWVRMDNAPFQSFNNLVTSGWQWIKLQDYQLSAGAHTLTFGYRENGALLDKILVTNYPGLPSGLGGVAVNNCNVTSIDDHGTADNALVVWQNYPNPFSGSTNIIYQLLNPGEVNVAIYTMDGRKLETLADNFQTTGNYQLVWQAGNLPEGVYFCRFQVDGFVETRKLLIRR